MKLLYLTLCLLGLSFWTAEIADPDLGWHLFGGMWILGHHALPAIDPINTFNAVWLDYHWLGQVLFAALYSYGGFPLLKVFIGIVSALLLVMIAEISRACMGKNRPWPVIAGICICSAYLVWDVTSVRPQMLALLLLAAALRRLVRRPARTELPYLFACTVMLANIHVYWVLVPALWFFFRCLRRVDSQALSARYSWFGLALLLLAGACSPLGFMNYYVIWDYLQVPAILVDTISEFRSAFTRPGIVPALLVAWLLIVGRAFHWRLARKDPGSLAAAALGLFLPFSRVKFLPVFVLFALPLTSRLVSASFRRMGVVSRVRLFDLTRVACVVLVLVGAGHAVLNWPWPADQTLLKETQPLDACRAITQLQLAPRDGRDHIRILTHFNHGGWCRWQMYLSSPDSDYRVTTDGRTQNVPGEHYKLSFDLFGAKEGWNKTLGLWNPDAIVAPRSTALANVLIFDPRWHKIYEDSQFAVFVPRPTGEQT